MLQKIEVSQMVDASGDIYQKVPEEYITNTLIQNLMENVKKYVKIKKEHIDSIYRDMYIASVYVDDGEGGGDIYKSGIDKRAVQGWAVGRDNPSKEDIDVIIPKDTIMKIDQLVDSLLDEIKQKPHINTSDLNKIVDCFDLIRKRLIRDAKWDPKEPNRSLNLLDKK